MKILDRKLTDQEIKIISTVISDSFLEDSFIKQYYHKHRDFENLAYIVTKFCNKYGEIHFFDDYSGAALWIPPGIEFLSKQNLKTILFKDVIYYVLHSSLKTTLNIIKTLRQIHEGHVNKPHYYLYAIGIDKEKREKGLGTELMNFAFNKFGNQVYFLESSNNRNTKFYMGLGFSIIGRGSLNGAEIIYMAKNL